MTLNKSVEELYVNRVFENSKNYIPKYDYPYFYLLTNLPEDKSIKILDAGCGSGKYCNDLVQKGYSNIFGIDLFEESNFQHFNFSYSQGSIEEIPFEENSFDLIFANSVIMHIKNPEVVFREFYRMLKLGGKVIITGHTKNSLFTYWRKVKLFFNHKSSQNLKHAYFRKTKDYVKLLQNNNFEIILRDGYYMSFLFYPYYRKKAVGLIEKYGWKLPLLKPKYSNLKFWAKIKSEHAYHFVIISRKTA